MNKSANTCGIGSALAGTLLFATCLAGSLCPGQVPTAWAEESTAHAVAQEQAAKPAFNAELGAYEIGTAEQFDWFARKVSDGDVSLNARLTADLDLRGNTAFIGSDSDGGLFAYEGTFDGCGHTVTVNIEAQPDRLAGVFNKVNGATIKNLTVEGSVQGGKYAAGIVACARGSAEKGHLGAAVLNCTNNAVVESETAVCAGGIVGCADVGTGGALAIGGCTNVGRIASAYDDAFARVGGIVGRVGDFGYTGLGAVAIAQCQNFGDVSGGRVVGGIAGQCFGYPALIEECSNEGTVAVLDRDGACAAGIIGFAGDHIAGGGASISRSCNTGSVFAPPPSAVAGGIAGCLSMRIDHCYNAGSIDSPSPRATAILGDGYMSLLGIEHVIDDCFFPASSELVGVGNGGGWGNAGYLRGYKSSAIAVSDDEMLTLADRLGEPFVNLEGSTPMLAWQFESSAT